MRELYSLIFLLLYCAGVATSNAQGRFIDIVTRPPPTVCPLDPLTNHAINPTTIGSSKAVLDHSEQVAQPASDANSQDKRVEEADGHAKPPPSDEPKPQIATFDEWTKEKLKQELKRNEQLASVQPVVNGAPQPHVKNEGSAATRNYASRECGAKIITANAGAENTKALLNDKEKDEYMRSPCDISEKFIVIELCETIQPHTIELGNYELFSSGPKAIRVSAAEKFPANEWSTVLEIEAQDSRFLQTFRVTKMGLYAKFLKVELLSHYGKEHYCTLTMLRVLGMSIVEEYEAEAEIAAGRIGSAANTATATQPVPPAVVEVQKEITQKPPQPPAQIPPTPELIKPKLDDSTIELPKKSSLADPSNESQLTPRNLLRKIVNVWSFGTKKEIKFNSPGWYFICNVCAVQKNRTLSAHSKRFCEVAGLIIKTRPVPKPAVPNRKFLDTLGTRRRYRRLRFSFLQRFFLTLAHVAPPQFEQTPAISVETTPSSQEPIKAVEQAKEAPPAPEPATGIPEKPMESPPPPPKPIELKQAEKPVAATGDQPATSFTASTTTAQVTTAPIKEPVPESLPASSLTHKESVFIKLNKRIAALELNMSLSSEYLSELSRQYVAQSEAQEKNIVRAKRIADEAVINATTHINKTLNVQLETMRREVDELAKFLKTVRQESAHLQLRLAYRGYKEEAEDHCDSEEADDDDVMLHGQYYDIGSRDGVWTTEQVVYVVVGVQVLTVFIVAAIQWCFRSQAAPKVQLTLDDVNRIVELKMQELQVEALRKTPPPASNSSTTAGSGPTTSAKRRRRRKRKEHGETDSAVDSSLPTASMTHSDMDERDNDLTAMLPELEAAALDNAHCLESVSTSLVEPLAC